MKLFALLSLVLLTSCAATYNTNFPLIETGNDLNTITTLIGKPLSAESGPDNTKILYYRLASSLLDTDGSDTREYYVVMKESQVIGYGERTDAITAQRAARQFNAAWNGAKTALIGAQIATPRRVEVRVK